MITTQDYDVVIIGAGHAGCEAAAAAANLGARALLITMDMTKMGQMSCNPAVGGIAKGQIVREIDALGGYTGIVTDRSAIQFRMLNRSKGPAMWSPRAQCDRTMFTIEWRNVLESTPNVDFLQDMVSEFVVNDKKEITGVVTRNKIQIQTKTVILTSGTFLNGLMHVGANQTSGGRAGEMPSFGITGQLKELGITTGRMKTGTPPRLDGRSIDFSVMEEQHGDENPQKFSYLTDTLPLTKQRSCFITYTSTDVHDTLRTGFAQSPLFNGTIKGVGPRYCPSIEDKVVTFADKERHQLFLEPEGWGTVEYYINGFSTSLPIEVQLSAIRKVRGLENVKLFRPGYAVEYDFFDPTLLYHTLESKIVKNLYLAGQVNGTTGYEEAAAQGLMAGINAGLRSLKKSEFILNRDEAYIGVLIDDLVTKGVDEPYRMFTSRAEFRILLRQDNADMRLTRRSHEIGLASNYRLQLLEQKEQNINRLLEFCKNASVQPDKINARLEALGSALLSQASRLQNLILRPQVGINDLLPFVPELQNLVQSFENRHDEIIEATEVLIKYSGYIDKERQLAEKLHRLEDVKLNPEFDYSQLMSLSTEARQKLSRIKPTSIGQASRISGVSPSDVNVLLVHMGR